MSSQKYSVSQSALRLSVAWRGAGCLFALLLLAGCGEKPGPMPLDKQLAKNSLTNFLEAWKNGEKSEGLKNKSPAIVGSDEAWDSGAKLIRYTIQEPVKDDGSNLHANVELVLQMPDGGQQMTKVHYIVGTSPKISVFRK